MRKERKDIIAHIAQLSILEIYRIVSNKALESSNNTIKPTSGQTILVSQSPDEQAKQGGGGCC